MKRRGAATLFHPIAGLPWPALLAVAALLFLLPACAPKDDDEADPGAPAPSAGQPDQPVPSDLPSPSPGAAAPAEGESGTASTPVPLQPAPPAPAPSRPAIPSPYAARFAGYGEVSVMTFNLNHYGLRPSDDDATVLQPKPPSETAALIETIRLASPDVLVVQEMGGPDAWAEFQFRLREAGLTGYAYDAYLRRGRHDLNLALLSRFPIAANNSHVDDTYTIGPAQFPVMRGFLDVTLQISPTYALHILAAHLKSKVFHSFGAPEMRRNEARLLGNHVRAALHANPDDNLLVLGDLNDDPTSAPLRSLLKEKGKPLLYDLRPTDATGAAWTHRDADDTYTRIDYMLLSPGLLPEAIPEKTYIPESRNLHLASDHRPLVATFQASDRPSTAPLLDLSTRLPPSLPTND